MLGFLFISLFISGCAVDEPERGENITKENYSVEILINDLTHPWGLAFVDDNLVLITEKRGVLSLFDKETLELTEISGVPGVDDSGQGGLLDVEYDDGIVYLTYVSGDNSGTGTHLGRGFLDVDSFELLDFEVLYKVEPFMHSGAHFGSRVVVKDDYLFLSTGDRGQKDFGPEHIAQDTQNPNGAVIRLYKNGSIPSDNPFVGDEDFLDEIYSYGHRNIQGLTLHPQTSELWASEHGERDGDEINIIQKGGNHGWPIAHYGCQYGTTTPVGEKPHDLSETVDPVYYWECQSGGFPPAGMTFYFGEKFEDWQGNLFLGNLAGRYLGRFEVENNEVVEVSPLLEDEGWRIRDVKESSNGYLYVITDENPGHLLKISSN